MRKQLRTASITAGVTLFLLLGRITPAFAQQPPGGPKLDQPKYDPDAPGIKGVSDLGGALVTYIFVFSLLALLISLLLMLLGNGLRLTQVAEGAKIGAIVSVVVAFVTGSAAAVINWAYTAGGGM